MNGVVERAAAALTAIAEEHGHPDGVGVLWKRYGLDEEDLNRFAVGMARSAMLSDDLESAIAGVYGAGVLLGLRIAEERS